MQVLLRALRDFNMGKLTADDEGIFIGLLNDLFPKTNEFVPRSIDHAFEVKVGIQVSPSCSIPYEVQYSPGHHFESTATH